jgi:hypothetical protein
MTIKAIVRTCFGKDFFQTEEKVIELKKAYDKVSIVINSFD